MDRNLGATSTNNDATGYGDLFQWGRLGDGHQLRSNPSTWSTATLATTNIPLDSKFITSASDWRSVQTDNLWQGVNGINNPCPVGWRIPTYPELEAERLSWSSNNADGAYASVLKLTMAGYRYRSDALLGSIGIYGYYWSSTVSGAYAAFLLFYASNAYHQSSNARASGFSVRCIRD